MPNINLSSPDASTSHISLPRYPPPARQGRESRTLAAEPDVEAGNNDINVINPSTSATTVVMYGHDEKFAMFGQL